MADAVLDLGALDSAATTVEATPDATVETPTVESTTPETDSTTTTESAAESETKEGSEKPVESKPTDPALVSLKAINAQLNELKETNRPLAKALHSHVKASLQTQAFLKELDVTSLDQAKEKLSTNPEVEAFTESVRNADELLYRGNLSELSTDVLEDLEAELGTKEAATQRFAQFTEAAFDALKTATKTEHVNLTRSVLVDALYDSKFPEAINALSSALKGNDTSGAKQIVSELVRWFSDEQKTDDERRVQSKAALDTAKNEATSQTQVRAAVEKDIDYASNRILGTVFGELMRGPLKSLNRFEVEDIATDIRDALTAELKKDAAYQKQWKGKLDKATLLKSHEAKLKTIAKDLVTRIATAKHPSLFVKAAPVVAKPVAAAKPTATPSQQIKIGGQLQTVFQVGKRPANLIRVDTTVAGRLYTTSDLQLLQASKGIALVPLKNGKNAWVQWKR